MTYDFIKSTNNPLLAPDQPWEGGNVCQPGIVKVGSEYRLYYSCNAPGGFAVALATASAVDGPYTKQGIILGNGVGGVISASRGQPLVHGGLTYIYFEDGPGSVSFDASLRVAYSSDGLNFKVHDGFVSPSGFDSKVVVPYGAQDTTIGNCFPFTREQPDGSTCFYLMYDALQPGTSVWRTFIASAPSPLGPFTKDARGAITSLQVGNSSYGAPGGKFCGDVFNMFMLNSPNSSLAASYVYHHASKDLRNFTLQHGGQPVITPTQAWEHPEDATVQTSDPSFLDEGETISIFYDAITNQPSGAIAHGIGVATYSGTLASITPSDVPASEMRAAFLNGTSAFLSRTPAAGDRQKWTVSAWVKRAALSSAEHNITGMNYNAAGPTGATFICLYANKLMIYDGDIGLHLQTNATFTDLTEYYHVVVAVDTTLATPADRVKVWVTKQSDGAPVQITSFFHATYPAQNALTAWHSAAPHYIGKLFVSTMGHMRYFPGLIADFNDVDGAALQPSEFGESVSGIWQPKPFSAHGAVGSYLDFSNAGILGKDASGNGNDWLSVNATQTG